MLKGHKLWRRVSWAATVTFELEVLSADRLEAISLKKPIVWSLLLLVPQGRRTPALDIKMKMMEGVDFVKEDFVKEDIVIPKKARGISILKGSKKDSRLASCTNGPRMQEVKQNLTFPPPLHTRELKCWG